MRQKSIQHHTDALAALLLFGVFAACVLAVLLTGANAYRRLTLRDRAVDNRRTCVQYIATRVRQGDVEGGVTVEPFQETNALCLAQDGYVTRVYWYDGYLMELYCFAEERPGPEDGQRMMEAEALAFSLEDGLLTVDITTAGGGEETLLLSLRGGEEGTI